MKSIRERIKLCSVYTSGNAFTMSDLKRHLGESQPQLNGALMTMIERDEVIVLKKTNKGATYQRRVSDRLLRQHWAAPKPAAFSQEMQGYLR